MMNHNPGSPAFTLIELLVVITIIVILLALLTPALDKAIHQAELAVCASNLSAINRGATIYAAENKRQYLYRPTTTGKATVPNRIYSPDASGAVGPRLESLDDRPYLERYMSINKALHCPLSEATDLLIGNDSDSWLLSSYQLYFRWQFRFPGSSYSGMFKLGDRFAYDTERFDIIAADRDVVINSEGAVHGSHPDDEGHMSHMVMKNENWNNVVKVTWNTWAHRSNPQRGLIDRNFTYADGSTSRITDLEVRDYARLARVPEYNDGLELNNSESLPRDN